MLLESQGVNLNTADTRYDITPLEWASQRGHEGVVKLLSGWKDARADGKFALPPTDPGGQEVMDLEDSVSVSAGSDISSEPSRPLQPSPTSYSSTIQAILSFVDRCSIIPSLICFIIFLLYLHPDSQLDAFSFCGCLLSVGLVWARHL